MRYAQDGMQFSVGNLRGTGGNEFRASSADFARTTGSVGIFVVSLLVMAIVCVWAWDAFVNGRLYYCTDGGTMDFIFVGDWVHHPESVAHVVPRSMSEPDEIKAGWSVPGLWCLWCAFVGGSTLVSALLARALWSATSPKGTQCRGGRTNNECGTLRHGDRDDPNWSK